MSTYRAPIREMRFVMDSLGAFAEFEHLPSYAESSAELAQAVLEESARWTEEVLAPLNTLGDREGTPLTDGQVRVPGPIKQAYAQFVDGGWAGLTAPAAIGGHGLPLLVSTAVSEMWKSANLAFSLCPMLSQAAIEALAEHASPELQARLLPGLVAGTWTGTMNLTEPQAGSDLGAIQASASPDGQAFRLRGRKIFITWGDHDMSENIVHLVLARLPSAAPGVKGISLFAVPKRLVDETGRCGALNDITTVSVEHKLGIRGSPTCVLSYGDRDGAVGWLVGQPHRGLEYMFTMMNRARLAVGVEAMAMAERAYQGALAYARERVQGRPPGYDGPAAIAAHPDVRRMLMTLKAGVEAMRGLLYAAALSHDLAHSESTAIRDAARARLALLTPIAKGWCTEFAQELVALSMQIHGGAGYIEEAGPAQWLRDVRITTIYEGTTGIQANDLVYRKLLADSGQGWRALREEVLGAARAAARESRLPPRLAQGLTRGVACADRSIEFVLAAEDPNAAAAAAVNLLMLLGIVLGGWRLVEAARFAQQAAAGAAEEWAGLAPAKIGTAVFYGDHVLPRSEALAAAILAGSDSVMALSDADLGSA